MYFAVALVVAGTVVAPQVTGDDDFSQYVCNADDVTSAQIDDDGMTAADFERTYNDANSWATNGLHEMAAESFAKAAKWHGLASRRHLLASTIFNFAQSLMELPACLLRAEARYDESAKMFTDLEQEARAAGEQDEETAFRAGRAKALLGKAVVKRVQCGGTNGADRVAKGRRKYCHAAQKLLRTVQKLMPDEPVAYVNEGNLLIQLAKPLQAANCYLKAAQLNPAMAHNAHPSVREFVLNRMEFENGEEAHDLVELSWFQVLPTLSLNEDCTIREGGLPHTLMISECSWKDFRLKNPQYAASLQKAIRLSWDMRSSEVNLEVDENLLGGRSIRRTWIERFLL